MRKRRPALLCSWLAAVGVGAPTLAHATEAQQGSFSGASDAFFGYSVAIDGATAIVGAWNDNGTAGAAYVYVQSGSTWSLQQQLVASDGAANDNLGYTVAVSGNTALIGAPGKANDQGYVYAFTRSGSVWTQQQEFTETSGAANDCFGCALALSGSTAVIGAPAASGNVGTAYVFTSSGGSWSQQAEFLGPSPGDYFGFSVALSPSAGTAVVGAFATASNKGSAYVFTQGGATWVRAPVLTATGASAGDAFGYSVAASNSAILVGAYAAGGPGAAYLFTQSGSTWTQAQKIVPPDPTGNDYFGVSVALSGSTAVVGADEHSSSAGATYVYTSGAGGLAFAQELSGTAGQSFGYAVAASSTTLAVGAFGASNDSGAAYLYAPAATTPPPPAPALGRAAGTPALMALLGLAGILASRSRRGVPQP